MGGKGLLFRLRQKMDGLSGDRLWLLLLVVVLLERDKIGEFDVGGLWLLLLLLLLLLLKEVCCGGGGGGEGRGVVEQVDRLLLLLQQQQVGAEHLHAG
jgi:hypothetical protein